MLDSICKMQWQFSLANGLFAMHTLGNTYTYEPQRQRHLWHKMKQTGDMSMGFTYLSVSLMQCHVYKTNPKNFQENFANDNHVFSTSRFQQWYFVIFNPLPCFTRYSGSNAKFRKMIFVKKSVNHLSRLLLSNFQTIKTS